MRGVRRRSGRSLRTIAILNHQTLPPMSRSTVLAAFALLVLACKDKSVTSTPVSSTPSTPVTGKLVTSSDSSFDVQIPPRWTGAFRVDSLASTERGSARPGALNIVYLPVDTTVLPQTLVVVAVYDSIAWARVKKEGGPPPGDSIKAAGGRVYVLGLPQSNPFTPGSVDALKFDSLALNSVERAGLIHVRN